MTFEDTYKVRKSHLYSSVTGEREGGGYSTYNRNSNSGETLVKPSAPSRPTATASTAKPSSSSAPKSTASSSSFLSGIANSAISGGKSSSSISYGSSSGGVKSQLENRLRWMETAFKPGDTAGSQSSFNAKAIIGSARRRIMVMLREQITPQLRTELEALDKELAEIGDHV